MTDYKLELKSSLIELSHSVGRFRRPIGWRLCAEEEEGFRFNFQRPKFRLTATASTLSAKSYPYSHTHPLNRLRDTPVAEIRSPP